MNREEQNILLQLMEMGADLVAERAKNKRLMDENAFLRSLVQQQTITVTGEPFRFIDRMRDRR